MGLFRLLFSVGVNATDFKVGMRQVESSASVAAKNVAGYFRNAVAGWFSVQAIASMTRATMQFADDIKRLSDRTGLSAEAMQELRFAAEQTGVSVDAVVSGMERLSKVRAAVLAGSDDKAAGILGVMGIDQAKLQAQPIMDTFRQIAEFVRTNRLGSNEGAVMQALFGRGGGQLLPMMRDDLDGIIEKLRDMNGVLSGDTINRLDEVGDAWQRMSRVAVVSMGRVLDEVAKANEGTARQMDDIMGSSTAKKAGFIASALANPGGFISGLIGSGIARGANPAIPEASPMTDPLVTSAIEAALGGGSAAQQAKAARFQTVSRNQDFGSLASVGGFFGLGGTRDATVTYLKRIEDNTKKTADNTDPNKEGDDF